MRHGKKFNHLTRKKGHRESLLMNMAMSLIRYKRINTTLAKAKALRVYVEPLLTRAKENTTHNRRVVFSYLQDKYSINELFGPIAEKIADRPGGYVRILRTGYRWGDNAETAMIELVDFNELRNEASEEKAGRRRRRKKSVSSTGTAPVVAQPKVVAPEPVVEDVAEDVAEDVVAPVVEEVKEAEVVVEPVADVVEEQPAAEEEKTSTDEEESKG